MPYRPGLADEGRAYSDGGVHRQAGGCGAMLRASQRWPVCMKLFRAALIAALTGLAAPSAWAQGCCLTVRPAPAPVPSLRLDATAPALARLPVLGDPFGQ